MPHIQDDEELDFSAEPDPEEELDFDIDVDVDDDCADDTALERELGSVLAQCPSRPGGRMSPPTLTELRQELALFDRETEDRRRFRTELKDLREG